MSGRTGAAYLLRLTVLGFGAFPEAVPRARRHARDALGAWGVPGITQDAELITSELVANAVRASLAGRTQVYLRLLAEGGRVIVEVRDQSAEPPLPRVARYADEGGRGLAVVAALSRRWGYYFDAGWKAVWAELGIDGVAAGGTGDGGGAGDGFPETGAWDDGAFMER